MKFFNKLFFFFKVRLEEIKKAAMNDDPKILELNKIFGFDRINQILPQLNDLLGFFNDRQFNLILSILEDSRFFKKE